MGKEILWHWQMHLHTNTKVVFQHTHHQVHISAKHGYIMMKNHRKCKSVYCVTPNFQSLPLGFHRSNRASKLLWHNSPLFAQNFKPKCTSICPPEAEIWPKTCFFNLSANRPWPLTLLLQKSNILRAWPGEHSLREWAK